MESIWRRLGGEVVYDAGIFKVRSDRYERLGQPTHPFHVIDANAWTNVVALTGEGDLVLVRQFRHGIQESSLEIPGGMVDDRDADPAAAAARELLEETGYAGGPMRLLGSVTSNPAILTNRTHCFLTTGAHKVAEPAPDEHEDLSVELCSVAEVQALMERGEIHHSLSVCALGLYFLRGDA